MKKNLQKCIFFCNFAPDFDLYIRLFSCDPMNKIYAYFREHRFALWFTLLLCIGASAALAVQCNLTEDISALLPKGNNPAMDVTFNKLKVKDMIFVRAEAEDDEILHEALTEFLDRVVELDSADGFVESVLYRPDPSLLMDAAMWVSDHAVTYLDFTEEGMDTITSVPHIVRTLQAYERILDTDAGAYLYDILAYDPCGMAMETFMFNTRDLQEAAGGLKHLFPRGVAFIAPTIGTTQSKSADKLIRHLEQAEKEVNIDYPDVTFHYHGIIVESAGNSRQIKRDLATTVAISLLIAMVLLGIFFRHPKYLVIMLLPVVFGALMALAIIYLYQGTMSIMALGLGAIVMGVALSYVMHVLIHFVYTGNGSETVRVQTKPVLMGSLTTIGAFAGLLFTESPLLQNFGLFALLTVFGTTMASLIFMPQFFPRNYEPNRKAFALLERLNSMQPERKPWLVAGVMVVVIAAICFSGKYTFDSNLMNIGYRSPKYLESVQGWNDYVSHGHKQQFFAAMSTDLDEALASLPAIEECCAQLQEEGLIHGYMKTSSLMPSMETQEQRLEHWSEYFTPEMQQKVWRNVERACAKENIDPTMFDPFREKMENPGEAELLYESEMVPEELIGNLVEKIGDYYLVFFPVTLDATNLNCVTDRLMEVPNCVVLNPFYYATSLVELTRIDFNRIMMISSIFVFLLLFFTYLFDPVVHCGSEKSSALGRTTSVLVHTIVISLIAFAPMMLSWYAVLGAMAIAGQPFNLLNIVVSSFIFGIGVDYSIFIMDGLMHAENSPEGARLLTMHKTAITLSGFVLILCMFSLIFAEHPAIHGIAFCSLFGMITTMLLSYTIQPLLYRWYMKNKSIQK